MSGEFSDRAEALRARAEKGAAETVYFTQDEPEFVGCFLRYDEGRTSFGPCLIAIFADESGAERAVWCFHKVLAGELLRARPEPGELVLIRSLGRVRPEGGGPGYESYRVVVDRESGGGLSLEEAARLAGAGPDEVRTRPSGDPGPEADFAPADEDIPF